MRSFYYRAVILSVAVVIIQGSVWLVDRYLLYLVSMLSIKCQTSNPSYAAKFVPAGQNERYFLIKRKFYSDDPAALFHPATYSASITASTRHDDFVLSGWLRDATTTHYYFGYENLGFENFVINRQTLEVIDFGRSEDIEPIKLKNCVDISIEEFNDASDRMLEQMKAKQKF
ncbi:hypothetical protein [Magnetovibrio blakemorei]|nr:hypothetical protein [Magnetovibrio blakemorei]